MSYIPFKEVREEITREHILKALKEMKANGIENYAPSTGFDLKYKGDKYPPKEVIQETVRIKYGDGAGTGLNGGGPTNDPLLDLGFDIYMKDGRKYEKGMKCRTLKKKKIQTNPNNNTTTNTKHEAYEGEQTERTVMSRTRDRQLAETRKKQDSYTCKGCNFYYDDAIVECHHLVPVSSKDAATTKMKDLITLCPNCHRLAHHLIKKYGNEYTERKTLIKELKKIHGNI